MKLKDVLRGLNYNVIGDEEVEICGIENNSQKIEKDYLFVCIRGFKVDGHEYMNKAIENGASAIVVDEEYNGDIGEVTVVKVKDTRLALAIISREFLWKSFK